jgi:hypothetical protein
MFFVVFMPLSEPPETTVVRGRAATGRRALDNGWPGGYPALPLSSTPRRASSAVTHGADFSFALRVAGAVDSVRK